VVMIYMVEVENDDGVTATREYDCASIVEALATAQLDLRKFSLGFVTNVWAKPSQEGDNGVTAVTTPLA
jgi:hypothetical protein